MIYKRTCAYEKPIHGFHSNISCNHKKYIINTYQLYEHHCLSLRREQLVALWSRVLVLVLRKNLVAVTWSRPSISYLQGASSCDSESTSYSWSDLGDPESFFHLIFVLEGAAVLLPPRTSTSIANQKLRPGFLPPHTYTCGGSQWPMTVMHGIHMKVSRYTGVAHTINDVLVSVN